MKNISMILLNTRGASSANFLSSIHELIQLHDPNMVALVETQMSSLRSYQICNCIGFDGILTVDAQVVVVPISLNPQHITVEVYRLGEEPWLLSAIYAAPHASRRLQLWKDLREFAHNNNHPWILFGDFNATLSASERTYDSESTTATSLAFSWVNDLQLLDLDFSGPQYTWIRGIAQETYKASRMDKGLCTDSWHLRFPEGVVQHPSTPHSNHLPLLIHLDHLSTSISTNRPFRFQAA
ncbi:hypothetical protein V2J09_011268 [Rumex salicifolius]